jgi:hypothetical protein
MSQTNAIKMPGVQQLPEKTPRNMRSTMDTVLVTRDGLKSWKLPPFQRPLRVNAKLIAISEEIKGNGGMIPGIITIGVLNKEKYIIDGQHRLEAFRMSALHEGLADIRLCYFDTMAEMGDEFVSLNSSIVKLLPDDILRGLEGCMPSIQFIRKQCPFIGYDNIRRGQSSPILSMALALRAWFMSAPEVPVSGCGSARGLAERLDDDEARRVSHFLGCCFEAWGNDKEYAKMWGSLNLTITAWLWRRVVVFATNPRLTKLTPQQFTSGLRAMTASSNYMDWIIGRQLNERDRSPCYTRIKTIFTKRLEGEVSKKIMFPSPPWAAASSSTSLMSERMGLNG